MTTPNDEQLLARIVGSLAPLPGIRAVVLGGSRARGTATPESDYDIGLYYDGHAPFDAIPPAVLVAVIAPTALATGWPETVAAAVTIIAATRLPLLATVAVGVLSVVALRSLA